MSVFNRELNNFSHCIKLYTLHKQELQILDEGKTSLTGQGKLKLFKYTTCTPLQKTQPMANTNCSNTSNSNDPPSRETITCAHPKTPPMLK